MIILPVGVKLVKSADQLLKVFFCETETNKSCEGIYQSPNMASNYILRECYGDFWIPSMLSVGNVPWVR